MTTILRKLNRFSALPSGWGCRKCVTCEDPCPDPCSPNGGCAAFPGSPVIEIFHATITASPQNCADPLPGNGDCGAYAGQYPLTKVDDCRWGYADRRHSFCTFTMPNGGTIDFSVGLSVSNDAARGVHMWFLGMIFVSGYVNPDYVPIWTGPSYELSIEFYGETPIDAPHTMMPTMQPVPNPNALCNGASASLSLTT